MVLTSSANAVVPKKGSEAYDTSKTALNHLIRELAIKLGPNVRVNGIAPATVVAGSTMFPRDRVIQSLQKYKIAFLNPNRPTELRGQAGRFLRSAHADKAAHYSRRLCGSDRVAGRRSSAKTTGTSSPWTEAFRSVFALTAV